MEQITLRLPAEVIEDVEAEAEESGESRSEHLRDVIESRNEHAEEVDELRAEVNELRSDLERVRREKRMILEEREEKKELAKWAESKADLEERRRSAPVWERAKWWVLGDGQE